MREGTGEIQALCMSEHNILEGGARWKCLLCNEVNNCLSTRQCASLPYFFSFKVDPYREGNANDDS